MKAPTVEGHKSFNGALLRNMGKVPLPGES